MKVVNFLIYIIYEGLKTPGRKRTYNRKYDTQRAILIITSFYGFSIGLLLTSIYNNQLFLIITAILFLLAGILAPIYYTEQRISKIGDKYEGKLSLIQCRILSLTIFAMPIILIIKVFNK